MEEENRIRKKGTKKEKYSWSTKEKKIEERNTLKEKKKQIQAELRTL